MSDEALDHVAKTMVTGTISKKIDGDTRPGHGRSDVLREAIEFYYEFRDRVMRESSPSYKRRQPKRQ